MWGSIEMAAHLHGGHLSRFVFAKWPDRRSGVDFTSAALIRRWWNGR